MAQPPCFEYSLNMCALWRGLHNRGRAASGTWAVIPASYQRMITSVPSAGPLCVRGRLTSMPVQAHLRAVLPNRNVHADQRSAGAAVSEVFVRSARKRCAIVECYRRHDEVYLTSVSLLKELGYEVHVFNVWCNRIKNSFVYAPGLKPRIHSHLKAGQVLAAVRRERFDLVVFNTFEGREVLSCARDILQHTPVLGFVHNGDMVCNLEDYQSFLDHPRCRFMVLGRHVGRHFAHLTTAGTVTPV